MFKDSEEESWKSEIEKRLDIQSFEVINRSESIWIFPASLELQVLTELRIPEVHELGGIQKNSG
jgi:hypothetical protein